MLTLFLLDFEEFASRLRETLIFGSLGTDFLRFSRLSEKGGLASRLREALIFMFFTQIFCEKIASRLHETLVHVFAGSAAAANVSPGLPLGAPGAAEEALECCR